MSDEHTLRIWETHQGYLWEAHQVYTRVAHMEVIGILLKGIALPVKAVGARDVRQLEASKPVDGAQRAERAQVLGEGRAAYT